MCVFSCFLFFFSFFFLMILPPPRSTLFPTRRSSDLAKAILQLVLPPVPEHDVFARPSQLIGKEDRLSEQARHETALLLDRKSTRLNSSHRCISYAVFCLKKKKKKR